MPCKRRPWLLILCRRVPADHASWSVFILDTAASIATSVPGTLDVGRICTPLPRPWYEYETVSWSLDEKLRQQGLELRSGRAGRGRVPRRHLRSTEAQHERNGYVSELAALVCSGR